LTRNPIQSTKTGRKAGFLLSDPGPDTVPDPDDSLQRRFSIQWTDFNFL